MHKLFHYYFLSQTLLQQSDNMKHRLLENKSIKEFSNGKIFMRKRKELNNIRNKVLKIIENTLLIADKNLKIYFQ